MPAQWIGALHASPYLYKMINLHGASIADVGYYGSSTARKALWNTAGLPPRPRAV